MHVLSVFLLIHGCLRDSAGTASLERLEVKLGNIEASGQSNRKRLIGLALSTFYKTQTQRCAWPVTST